MNTPGTFIIKSIKISKKGSLEKSNNKTLL